MACTGKGRLWKDVRIGRYQTLIKGRQKDRQVRRFTLERNGTGVEHLDRSLITIWKKKDYEILYE